MSVNQWRHPLIGQCTMFHYKKYICYKTLCAGSDHAEGEVADFPGHCSVQPVQDQE